MKNLRIAIVFVVIPLVSILLVGCTGSSNATTPSPEPMDLTPTVAPTATDVPLDQFLLVAPADQRGMDVASLGAYLEARAQEYGATFQWIQEYIEPNANPSYAFLLLIDQAEQAETWSRLNPDARILAIPGLQGELPDNISVLGADPLELEKLSFLAGYAAAVLAPDWRIAIIADSTTDTGGIMGTAFQQGAQFYCGLCRPERPPYEEYPLHIGLIPGDEASWGRVLDLLTGAAVDIVYLHPGILTPEQTADLLNRGILLIGADVNGNDAGHVMDMYFDPARFLETNWDSVSDASLQGGFFNLPITISVWDDEAVSTGRLDSILELRDALEEGYIGIGP